jgi:hypothetical protein
MFSFKLPARLLAVTLATAGLLVPAIASAQYAPSYAQPQYSQSQDESIHGRIYSIDGTFNITVTDDNGYMDNVQLHQGTVINPTGLTLAPGMEVTIAGYSGGQVFEANEIDTPYTYYGARPVPVFYGAGWWYPGYSYGYGPSFLLDVVIGGGGFRYERQSFDRNLWAVRSDDRFRGSRGFAPRTASGSNGNRGYVQQPTSNRGYTAPSRDSSVRNNNNTNYSNNRAYSAPARNTNVNVNANVNVNSNYANRGNAAPNRTGNGNNGNTGYRSAPQQSRPANTRSTGANETRTTNTSTSHSSDSGNRGSRGSQGSQSH